MQSLEKIGTYIHGIGSTNHIDSSGERVRLEGIDISSLTVNGAINYEHKAESTNQIIGKIIEAKKIYKDSDCENESHTYFFKKAEGPYLYIKAILFDKFNHSGAMDAVAMMQFDKANQKNKEEGVHQMVGFSIEGSKLEVKNGTVEKCIARKISFTSWPCNKMCVAEIYEPSDSDSKKISLVDFKSIFKKAEDMEKSENLEKALITPKSPAKQKIIAQNKEKRLKSQDRYVQGIKGASASASNPPVPKETTQTAATQPILSGSAWKASIEAKRQSMKNKPTAPKYDPNKVFKSSLRETIVEKSKLKKKIKKNLKEDCISSLDRFTKKEELIQFIEKKYPDMGKSEVMALASVYTFSKEKQQEEKLKELFDE